MIMFAVLTADVSREQGIHAIIKTIITIITDAARDASRFILAKSFFRINPAIY